MWRSGRCGDQTTVTIVSFGDVHLALHLKIVCIFLLELGLLAADCCPVAKGLCLGMLHRFQSKCPHI